MYEFTHGRGIDTLQWELSSSSVIYVSNTEIYLDSNVPQLLLEYKQLNRFRDHFRVPLNFGFKGKSKCEMFMIMSSTLNMNENWYS